MAKSQTPLKVGLLEGVTVDPDLLHLCAERGHEFITGDLQECDVILGPECYNYKGVLGEKEFNLITKSARQLVRERKREEKKRAKSK